MKMKSHHWLAVMFPLVLAACASPEPPAAPEAPVIKPHANMLQLMRAFPFPHANVLFDTQTNDPEGPDEKSTMVYGVYRFGDTNVYAKWAGVESSALALSEVAGLLLVPGRLCANGLPAPVEREDWKKYSLDLVEVGETAYKAAQTKNMDAMLDVAEKITIACAACHDVYRDIDQEGKMRCTVPQ